MLHRGVRVRHSRVEELFTLQKAGAKPNGLHFDAARDELLVADQSDGDLITVARPKSASRAESLFAAESPKPSGVTRCLLAGEDTIFMSGTYGLVLTLIQNNQIQDNQPQAKNPQNKDGTARKVSSIDHRGVGSGIVDFAADLLKGTHTGYHGLEWDGSHLWAASPPAKAIFRLTLEQRQIVACDFFPVACGNRPHGLAWADEDKTQLWCNDTTLGAAYRYDCRTGACLEILVLPTDAPESHGMTRVGDELWYCEDHSGKICRVMI
jgi:sugar lactone lactonase YvrE